MSSSNTTYLVTGANRGIGRGLVATWLARPNVTVIAAVRDPNHATAKSLADLSKGPSSALIIVKIESTSETDAAEAVKALRSDHHITHLDLVVANAGISKDYTPVAKLPLATLQEHVKVNAWGPFTLFQAVLPLLQAQQQQQPKFVGVGSPLGSIGGMELRPYPLAAYGISKAILHYMVRKIHFENEWLTSFVIDPGWVQTDLGNAGAAVAGMDKAITPTDESVAGVIAAIDGATREKTSGHFAGWNGEEFPW